MDYSGPERRTAPVSRRSTDVPQRLARLEARQNAILWVASVMPGLVTAIYQLVQVL